MEIHLLIKMPIGGRKGEMIITTSLQSAYHRESSNFLLKNVSPINIRNAVTKLYLLSKVSPDCRLSRVLNVFCQSNWY